MALIKKQFTKEQKHMLIQCIIDCDLFGLSDKEGMKYLEKKTGRSISLTSYQRYKKIALNENAANAWIDHFARIGFVDHYRKRMNEMETLQRNIYRQLNLELSKKPEEQNKKYIVALSSEIRQNNIHLCQLGIGMAVISKMKENIDGRKQKILSLANDYKNSHLLPSSKEIADMDEVDIESIIKEKRGKEKQRNIIKNK
ncbi:MAG: hypothetical protein AB7F53_03085 [Nitrososphaeraceae archaeon]